MDAKTNQPPGPDPRETARYREAMARIDDLLRDAPDERERNPLRLAAEFLRHARRAHDRRQETPHDRF